MHSATKGSLATTGLEPKALPTVAAPWYVYCCWCE